MTCGRCGCAFTAETKKGQYVYYHRTGHRGPCGNTYVREEELVRQFGELLRQVRIPTELAGKLATVLRQSQTDKEKFVRTSMLRLQQQHMLLRSKLDRVYEDRLSDAIPEELWNSKSAALQDELRRVRTEMERHEVASQACETAGRFNSDDDLTERPTACLAPGRANSAAPCLEGRSVGTRNPGNAGRRFPRR